MIGLRPAPKRHDFRSCRDRQCERFACQVWREAWDEGWQDGFTAGYSAGFSAGVASAAE